MRHSVYFPWGENVSAQPCWCTFQLMFLVHWITMVPLRINSKKELNILCLFICKRTAPYLHMCESCWRSVSNLVTVHCLNVQKFTLDGWLSHNVTSSGSLRKMQKALGDKMECLSLWLKFFHVIPKSLSWQDGPGGENVSAQPCWCTFQLMFLVLFIMNSKAKNYVGCNNNLKYCECNLS